MPSKLYEAEHCAYCRTRLFEDEARLCQDCRGVLANMQAVHQESQGPRLTAAGHEERIEAHRLRVETEIARQEARAGEVREHEAPGH